MIEHKRIKGLSFDDILLPPVYSDIRSRSEPDTTTKIGPFELRIPFISSPMDTVTGPEMAGAMNQIGGLGVIHRFMSPAEQVIACEKAIEAGGGNGRPLVAAIGVGESELQRLENLMETVPYGIDMVSIDIANGHSILMAEQIQRVKKRYPRLPIMAGNIATFQGYEFMAKLGVVAVRVGIGSGSICKTRIMTGFGIPILSSIVDCARARHKYHYYTGIPKENLPSIIADGGIRYPADVVKSIIGGADAVMCGGIFAGTDEAPGEVIELEDSSKVKMYRGAASASVQKDLRGGLKKGTCAEGVTTHIPYVGSVEDVLFGDDGFVGGLKSGMSYANAHTIAELQAFDEYIVISGSGVNESHAYGTKK